MLAGSSLLHTFERRPEVAVPTTKNQVFVAREAFGRETESSAIGSGDYPVAFSGLRLLDQNQPGVDQLVVGLSRVNEALDDLNQAGWNYCLSQIDSVVIRRVPRVADLVAHQLFDLSSGHPKLSANAGAEPRAGRHL